MELFDKNGCLTDEGLQALQAGGLDELGRLETAEHLAYCDKCMDRYTALLTADALDTGSQPEPDRRTCTAGPTGGGWPSACRAENTGPTGGGRRAEAAGVFFKGGQ